jgi:sirohydrochlorin ferrochelatase
MKPGLLVISHGSREVGWVTLVDEAVEAARAQLGSRMLIEAAFLELVEGRLIQDGIDRLESAGVTHLFALPLFVSSGSTHVDEIGWALGAFLEPRTETDLEPFQISSELTYGTPMDEDHEIVDVIMDRLKRLSKLPARESILLIGHGSKEEGFLQAWQLGLSAIGNQLMKQGGYAACSSALLQLDEVNHKWESLRNELPQNDILVIPIFLSEGYFTKQVIPRHLIGLECRYEGCTLMPHQGITEWIIRKTLEWLHGLDK